MIIDGKNTQMGRLASFVAKELLKGEEVSVVNCGEVIITGNRKNLEEEFWEKRARFGSSQKGPIHPKSNERIVKRAIRGMLPDHRMGRGRIAFKKLKCFAKLPKELEEKEKISLVKDKKSKFVKVDELLRK